MTRRLGGVVPLLLAGSLLGGACATAPASGALPTGAILSLSPSPSASPTPETTTVAVPDVRYQTVDLARISIKSLGLKLTISDKQESMDWQPETILSQDPKVGTLVDPGSKVKVTITILPKCDPSYPTLCLKPRGPDIDCSDLTVHGFKVLPPDPYHLDTNGDGIGCGRKLDKP
ncbi:MAG TPA: PASTA domain-containing protein [Actinomycetota bacterium]|nr:PASTA domain-containing protein [Actinomycetota bacterium]